MRYLRKARRTPTPHFRSYGKGESLLVIDDVVTIHCPNCGEGYLTAQTLKEIERIKRNRQTVASKRPVSVAVFD